MKRLPLNRTLEEMLVSAERYALGRRSYVVEDTVKYLTPLLRDMTLPTLRVLLIDMASEFLLEKNAPSVKPFGDATDRRQWMTLTWALKEELNRRGCYDFNENELELLEEAERSVGKRREG